MSKKASLPLPTPSSFDQVEFVGYGSGLKVDLEKLGDNDILYMGNSDGEIWAFTKAEAENICGPIDLGPRALGFRYGRYNSPTGPLSHYINSDRASELWSEGWPRDWLTSSSRN